MKGYVKVFSLLVVVSALFFSCAPKDKVLLEQEIRIPIQGEIYRALIVEGDSTLKIEVNGMENFDSGYSVFLIKAEDVGNFIAQENPPHIEGFDMIGVKSGSIQAEIEDGMYALAVENHDSWGETLMINVKVTQNPTK